MIGGLGNSDDGVTLLILDSSEKEREPCGRLERHVVFVHWLVSREGGVQLDDMVGLMGPSCWSEAFSSIGRMENHPGQ